MKKLFSRTKDPSPGRTLRRGDGSIGVGEELTTGNTALNNNLYSAEEKDKPTGLQQQRPRLRSHRYPRESPDIRHSYYASPSRGATTPQHERSSKPKGGSGAVVGGENVGSGGVPAPISSSVGEPYSSSFFLPRATRASSATTASVSSSSFLQTNRSRLAAALAESQCHDDDSRVSLRRQDHELPTRRRASYVGRVGGGEGGSSHQYDSPDDVYRRFYQTGPGGVDLYTGVAPANNDLLFFRDDTESVASGWSEQGLLKKKPKKKKGSGATGSGKQGRSSAKKKKDHGSALVISGIGKLRDNSPRYHVRDGNPLPGGREHLYMPSYASVLSSSHGGEGGGGLAKSARERIKCLVRHNSTGRQSLGGKNDRTLWTIDRAHPLNDMTPASTSSSSSSSLDLKSSTAVTNKFSPSQKNQTVQLSERRLHLAEVPAYSLAHEVMELNEAGDSVGSSSNEVSELDNNVLYASMPAIPEQQPRQRLIRAQQEKASSVSSVKSRNVGIKPRNDAQTSQHGQCANGPAHLNESVAHKKKSGRNGVDNNLLDGESKNRGVSKCGEQAPEERSSREESGRKMTSARVKPSDITDPLALEKWLNLKYNDIAPGNTVNHKGAGEGMNNNVDTKTSVLSPESSRHSDHSPKGGSAMGQIPSAGSAQLSGHSANGRSAGGKEIVKGNVGLGDREKHSWQGVVGKPQGKAMKPSVKDKTTSMIENDSPTSVMSLGGSKNGRNHTARSARHQYNSEHASNGADPLTGATSNEETRACVKLSPSRTRRSESNKSPLDEDEVEALIYKQSSLNRPASKDFSDVIDPSQWNDGKRALASRQEQMVRQKKNRNDLVRAKRMQKNGIEEHEVANGHTVDVTGRGLSTPPPTQESFPGKNKKVTPPIWATPSPLNDDRSHLTFDFSDKNLWSPSNSDSVSEWTNQSSTAENTYGASPNLPHWKEEERGWRSKPSPASEPFAFFHTESHSRTGISVDGYSPGFIDAVAAVVIQTTARRYLAVKAARKKLAAIRTIQIFAVKTKKKKRLAFRGAELRMYDTAAIQIQSLFRGWWIRDCLSVDHYCAMMIQKICRGYLGRLNFQFDLYRITIVQAVFRRNRAIFEAASRLAYVIILQSIYRAYAARKKYIKFLSETQEKEKKRREDAAIAIQTRWRSYDVQMNFMHTLADILIVQSVARRWLTMKLVLPYMQAQRLEGKQCIVIDEYSWERAERVKVVKKAEGLRKENGNSGMNELLQAWKERDSKNPRKSNCPSLTRNGPIRVSSSSPLPTHPRRTRLSSAPKD